MSRFWHYFISNGQGGRSCDPLGIQGHEVPLVRTVACRLGLTQPSGIEVWRINSGSPAEKAGILDDDILLRLADEPLASMEQLGRLLRRLRGKVPVELLRGEVRLQRWVSLAS